MPLCELTCSQQRVDWMEFRFAVGSPSGRRSTSWKVWSDTKSEIYLTQRSMGRVNKFSFHQGGDATYAYRWAGIAPHADGTDRNFRKWQRLPVPPKGSDVVAGLLSIIFPTNHLSSVLHDISAKSLHWFAPAPVGMAVVVDLFLTKNDRSEIEVAFGIRGERNIVRYTPLPNGNRLVIASHIYDCGPQEIRVPDNDPRLPGQVFGALVFPDTDPDDRGRPVRMMAPDFGGPRPAVWEFGGYEVSRRGTLGTRYQ